MATEVELKLYCAPDEMACVESHPLIAAGTIQGPAKRLENTYFDTPDLALCGRQIALRVRDAGSEQLQTIKCAAESLAGLSSRPEWETPFKGSFSFEAVDNQEVRAFLEARKSLLVPVLSTSFDRRTWRIDVTKKISICVMLDVGHISANGRVMPISEVELELIRGTSEDLLDFGIALATQLPLVPNNVSKAERGYQLFLNHGVSPQKAAQSPLTTKQTPAAAFQILARQGMQMWQANLLGTLMSQDQEFIHQFRVSLRRLNSLIKVFKPALPERFHTKWTKQAKTLSQITGDVRDLEVMRSGILEPMLQSDAPQIREHAKAALSALDDSKQQAVAQLRQLRYGGTVLMFARDLQELDTDDFPKNLPRFAENQLSGLHRNAIKRLNKVLKAPTPGRAHRFRIALKHLRYSCEFFAPLFDNAEMTEYAKAIAGLQDAFGFINDLHVALSRLQDWVEQEAISKQAREAVAEWHTPHAQEVLASALNLAESVMCRCHPWCTECERRGRASLQRRIQQAVKLQVE